MKTSSTKALLLALLLLLGMIVSPVCANQIVTTGYFPEAIIEFSQENVYNLTYSVNSSRAISNIQFRAPKGTELNYTITYGTGGSLSGYITYLPGGIDVFGYGEGITTINIGSSTDSRSFVDTGLFRKWEIVGYAREEDDNGTAISTGYAIYDVSLGVGNIGLQSGFIAYQSVVNVQPIESISFNSNRPVLVEIGTSDRAEIQRGITKTYKETFDEWMRLALYYSASIVGFIASIFWILKFFFIDNLLLVIALWISVSMVYSAITSPNIWGFYKKFFRTQKALLDFVIVLWTVLVSFLNYLVQIFVKWL